MAACFPADFEMLRLGQECHPSPAARLAQQPKAERFPKTQAAYAARAALIRDRWDTVRTGLTEAARFADDFTNSVQALGDAQLSNN
jgi:hypothetical protein